MKKFGLIGHPIAHSLSPALFKAAYNGKYTYDLIEEAGFETAYRRFLDGYHAINVTAPFKEQAFRMADLATEECKAIGAANMLLKQADGRILAANSDHFGVRGAVMSALHPDRNVNPTALILGCGGAAKAAIYAMCSSGYRTYIINRDFEKADKYARSLSANPDYDVKAIPAEEFRRCFTEAGIVIYTLPLYHPMLDTLTGDDIRGNTKSSKETKVLVEANYRDPAFTPELIAAMKKDNPELVYVNGKEWLLHQAVGAYGSFTGEKPNIGEMRKVL